MAKTKVLISCAVTTQLICGFVFAYAKSLFSHDAAHLKVGCKRFYIAQTCQHGGYLTHNFENISIKALLLVQVGHISMEPTNAFL